MHLAGFYYKNKYTQLQQLLVTCLKCSGNSSWKITVTIATKQRAHLSNCDSDHFTVTVKTFLQSLAKAEDFAFRIKFIHCFIKIFILSFQKFPLI